MRSNNLCHSGSLLFGLLFGLLGLWGKGVQAAQLNFFATVMPGTCTFNLSQSTLNLGTLMINTFQPSTLVGAQPFTLSVTNCSGTDALLTPVVSISGDGVTQDGRWLFRASDSIASGVGVMLVKTSVMPNYSDPEVKNGDALTLAAQGVNPVDQDISFYAGATCGGSVVGCESVGSGAFTARILFSLDYR